MVGTLKHRQHGGMGDLRFTHSKQNTHQNFSKRLLELPFIDAMIIHTFSQEYCLELNLFKNFKMGLNFLLDG